MSKQPDYTATTSKNTSNESVKQSKNPGNATQMNNLPSSFHSILSIFEMGWFSLQIVDVALGWR